MVKGYRASEGLIWDLKSDLFESNCETISRYRVGKHSIIVVK